MRVGADELSGARIERRDARLEAFRADWPKRVSWADVRVADPGAFRSAAQGARLGLLAVPATLLASSLTIEFPIAIPLPSWLDWGRALCMMAAMLVAIGCWIWAGALLSMPADARRGLAVQRFAERRGLRYTRFGARPERIGIVFAEGHRAADGASRSARRSEPSPEPLYDTQFTLASTDVHRRSGVPEMRIGVATYVGGKSDPKGPRPAFRYLSLRLPRRLPHLLIDSRRNGSLRRFLPGSQRISLEGDFDRSFTAYAPRGYERDALELLTPDVMACLIDHGGRWDVEVVDDLLIVASSRHRAWWDRAESTALLRFAELVGDELGHQAESYSDPRSSRPRSRVAEAGRRLRLRSAAWATVGCALFLAAWLGLPPLVEYLFGGN